MWCFQTYIEALCHGNLYEEEALGITNIFKQSLVKTALPAESRPVERIVKLDAGSAILHTATVKNEAEENSVVEVIDRILTLHDTRICIGS